MGEAEIEAERDKKEREINLKKKISESCNLKINKEAMLIFLFLLSTFKLRITKCRGEIFSIT